MYHSNVAIVSKVHLIFEKSRKFLSVFAGVVIHAGINDLLRTTINIMQIKAGTRQNQLICCQSEFPRLLVEFFCVANVLQLTSQYYTGLRIAQ